MKEKIEPYQVMEACRNGAIISYTLKGTSLWRTTTVPVWDWFHLNYRINNLSKDGFRLDELLTCAAYPNEIKGCKVSLLVVTTWKNFIDYYIEHPNEISNLSVKVPSLKTESVTKQVMKTKLLDVEDYILDHYTMWSEIVGCLKLMSEELYTSHSIVTPFPSLWFLKKLCIKNRDEVRNGCNLCQKYSPNCKSCELFLKYGESCAATNSPYRKLAKLLKQTLLTSNELTQTVKYASEVRDCVL